MKQEKFIDLYREALQLFKDEMSPFGEITDWGNWHEKYGVGVYFSTEEGDINEFTTIKYKEISIGIHSSGSINVEGLTTLDRTFNPFKFILTVKSILRGNSVEKDIDFYVKGSVVEREVVVVEENSLFEEYKTKAGMLDNLLSRPLNIQ